MLKALIKKQMLELAAWFFQDRNTGKNRSKLGIIAYGALALFIVLSFGIMFFMMGKALCAPLVGLGLDWLYVAIINLMAILMGVFGSVFNTFTSLYQAKDNELLLSLPIKPSRILAVRLFGVWFWGMLYTVLVFLPAMVVYWMETGWSVAVILAGIATVLILSVFVLVISCVLGYLVAKVNSRMKHKSIVTVVLSLAFIVVFLAVFYNVYDLLQKFLVNAVMVGEQVKGAIYPMYLVGCAGAGDWLAILPVAVCVLALGVVMWMVLSRSFLKLATTKSETARREYKEMAYRSKSVAGALFGKELKRFTSSANYMLNCGLGTLMLTIAAILALVKGDYVRELLGQIPGLEGIMGLMAAASVCMMASMNDITAPSVSLEGKTIWLAQSLPVSAWQVLKAKLSVHVVVTGIPALICSLCAAVAFRLKLAEALMMTFIVILFVVLTAAMGLVINLKLPNLTWTNEIAVIKQSFGIVLAMMGSWGIVLAFGGLYFLFGRELAAEVFLAICAAILAGCAALLLTWLKKKGAAVFARLSC